MKRYNLLSLFALLILFSTSVRAQDNSAVKIKDKLPVTGGEKTDLTFTRSLIIGSVDSVPFDVTRSGTYSLGIGYGIPLGRSVEIKFEPRVTWLKIFYRPVAEKNFPSQGTDSSLVYEKQRSFYLELPVGLKFKLARNADDRYKILLEGGFSFGLNLGSTAKIRREVDQDLNGTFDTRQTLKVHKIPDINALRYGPYVRVGTNWISIYAFYRMTEIFDPEETFGEDPTTGLGGRAYPKFPQIEFGFSIMI